MTNTRLNSQSKSAAGTESACSHTSGICMELQDLYKISVRIGHLAFFASTKEILKKLSSLIVCLLPIAIG